MTKVSRFLRSGSCLLAGAKFKCTNCQSCYNVETLLHEPASIVMSLTVYLFALHSFSRLWYLCFFLWIAVSVQLKINGTSCQFHEGDCRGLPHYDIRLSASDSYFLWKRQQKCSYWQGGASTESVPSRTVSCMSAVISSLLKSKWTDIE
jgi:hypothetical protein